MPVNPLPLDVFGQVAQPQRGDSSLGGRTKRSGNLLLNIKGGEAGRAGNFFLDNTPSMSYMGQAIWDAFLD